MRPSLPSYLSKLFIFLSFSMLFGPLAFAAEGKPFSHQTVIDLAKQLSLSPYQAPESAPPILQQLDYSDYRQIQFKKESAIWKKSQLPFSIELFSPGYLYKDLIHIDIVESGQSFPITVKPDAFTTPRPEISTILSALSRYAGFRLHFPVNNKSYADEFVVFQGASYFRVVSKGQLYGTSTRGLAINIAQSKGEEFPLFKRFWVERPANKQGNIVVHALLDSDSVTGAYRFGIYPGNPSHMDVSVELFPRKEIAHLGIAPLTSMFMHNVMTPPQQTDYRPAVHDAEALAVTLSNGEHLWRPLTNPKRLQISAIKDSGLKGFGLIQRHRQFEDYQDLEANYHRRPSVWVTPLNNWGDGQVQLVEIPSDSEGNDNIVSYWQPEKPLAPGEQYTYNYRLSWPNDISPMKNKVRIVRSALGNKLFSPHKEVVLDLSTLTEDQLANATIHASVSDGKVIETRLQHNPNIAGGRLFMTFDPEEAEQIEIRIQLMQEDTPLAETFLYRWVKDSWSL